MGVKDLWQLLSPVGRRVSIETLEGKTLAIDASIWITQFIKAMRDEDGKMMKNAHLIGTLRRILRLLYHKIRPLFVFDGDTPELKLRVVQSRRLGREMQEESKRVAAQRLLRAQLRMHAESQLNSTSSSTNANGAFVSSFRKNRSTKELQDGFTNAIDAEHNPGDVTWEDGYEKLVAKELDGPTSSTSDVEEGEWQLPEDADDLSPEVLSGLPPHIRKSLIEDARRRQRNTSRATYLPVAGNPALYSQTQLANFLTSSKLNRKFVQAQQSLEDPAQGIRIAAEGSRKYQLVSAAASVIKQRGNSEYGGGTGSREVSVERSGGATTASTAVGDWLDEVGEGSDGPSVRGGGFLICGEDNDGDFWEPISSNSPQHTAVEGGPFSDCPSASGARGDVDYKSCSALARDLSCEVTGEQSTIIRAAEGTTLGKNVFNVKAEEQSENGKDVHRAAEVEVARRGDQQYFTLDDSSIDRSGEGEDMGSDVAWESGSSSGDESEHECGVPMLVDSNGEHHAQFADCQLGSNSSAVDVGESRNIRQASSELAASFCFGSTVLEASLSGTVKEGSPNSTQAGATEQVLSAEAAMRAMHTAASMADWAGRVVRSALKEHMQLLPPPQKAGNQPGSALLQKIGEVVSNTVTTAEFESVVKQEEEVVYTSQRVENEHSAADNSSQGQLDVSHEVGDSDWRRVDEPIDAAEARRQFNRAMRDTETLTEELREEVIQLLQTMGLPYIIAPFEAEAQCAVLEQLGLVDGVVTEDSDAFLFGATTVYRHIFNEKKFVEVYLAEDVRRELGLWREDLVALAYFLGSDYAQGVNGVGIVNAVEIVRAFPMHSRQSHDKGPHPTENGQEEEGPLVGLRRFKEWLQGYNFEGEFFSAARHQDSGGCSSSSSGGSIANALLAEFTLRHRSGRAKWTVPDSFPDPRIARAYLRPSASYDPQPFSWKQQPDGAALRAFCTDTLGWTAAQAAAAVDPVLKRYAQRSSQARIDAHFLTYHSDTRFAKITSDRLREAVVQITGKRTNLSLSGNSAKKKKRKETDRSEL